MKNVGVYTLMLTVITSGNAIAQGTQKISPEDLYKAATNQLGIVEYCKDKGFATQEDIDGQKSIMNLMQAPADKAGLDETREAGKKGVVQSMGQETDVEEFAKTSGKSVEPFCQQITTAIKQSAAQIQK
ncbi:hypothetical protein HED50_13805 [Ochrobactrum oryzae]|nr:hypothetical protein [Brucella oryzae]MBR7653138.1 hypothetical protein [Brucella oryzae]NKC22746.1 hypothetical protein [Brucella oryzae]